jgi:hypothetical protein
VDLTSLHVSAAALAQLQHSLLGADEKRRWGFEDSGYIDLGKTGPAAVTDSTVLWRVRAAAAYC